IRSRGIRSIAVPPLGAGLGGLPWARARERIEALLGELHDVQVTVLEPSGVPASGRGEKTAQLPRLTPGRAALIGLMDRYLKGFLDPSISLLEVHKLMYFMQEAGEPLRLRIKKGPYGPYAENLRHVLNEIEGHYVTGFAAGGESPDKALELLPGAIDEARTMLQKQQTTMHRFERVAKLVDGFESAFGLELLGSVHWVMSREGADSEKEAVERTHAWGKRKQRFTNQQILLARHVLIEQDWFDGSF